MMMMLASYEKGQLWGWRPKSTRSRDLGSTLPLRPTAAIYGLSCYIDTCYPGLDNPYMSDASFSDLAVRPTAPMLSTPYRSDPDDLFGQSGLSS